MYVLPGHPRWYGVVGRSTWNELFLVFEGPVFDLCASLGLVDPAQPVRRVEPVQHWFGRLDTFRTRRPPTTAAGADEEACEVVQLLIDLAARGATPGVAGPTHPYARSTSWLEESKARLGGDLAEPVDLSAVATAVGMPYETWRKRFTALTGQSPARYRLLRRIEAAEVLLRRTSLTNRDIAASLGFSDEHHLSRQFRRIIGITTIEYRRTMA
ncbi:MAG: AraC family transcriptional regulator [Actinomycetota bacterium]|nr:AraC family transcriptional regulator [Actinomycetota bacterium]